MAFGVVVVAAVPEPSLAVIVVACALPFPGVLPGDVPVEVGDGLCAWVDMRCRAMAAGIVLIADDLSLVVDLAPGDAEAVMLRGS